MPICPNNSYGNPDRLKVDERRVVGVTDGLRYKQIFLTINNVKDETNNNFWNSNARIVLFCLYVLGCLCYGIF
jgi:hypothetical protein